MKKIPEIRTKNFFITLVSSSHAQAVHQYERRNHLHLSPWQPLRDDSYYSELDVKVRIKDSYQEFATGKSVDLIAMPISEANTHIIAMASFTNIIRGAFLACNLGYSIDEKFEGQGLMYEMIQASIHYMFTEEGMHRIMANYMKNNTRSENLLQRLGFNQEGIAKSYLNINGAWRDHVLTSLINPNKP